jgi:hypothetical protein
MTRTPHRVTQSGSGLTRVEVYGPLLPMESDSKPIARTCAFYAAVAIWGLIGWWVL